MSDDGFIEVNFCPHPKINLPDFLDQLDLAIGSHETPDEGMCLMEAVAFVAGESHSDSPECASPVLSTFGRGLNDALPKTKRQRLTPLIPRIVGTAGDGHDQTRGLMAVDWLIRTHVPAFLRLVPSLTAHAEALAGLPEVTSWDDVERVTREALRPAQKDSTAARVAARDAAKDAARNAAWDAAWAAARDAAWVAARDAAVTAARAATWGAAEADARDAARDAAWDAAKATAWVAAKATAWVVAGDVAWVAARATAWVAAKDVARGAAWAAAGAALHPTVDEMQDSAIDLFARMVEVTS